MAGNGKNIIWIFGDHMRGQALSCNGDPNVNTPNIDRLAVLGMNFTRAVSGSPVCSPFRGSLLTSRYPHACVPGLGFRMPPEQKTVAHVFNANGYDTAYFGKWHVEGEDGEEREGQTYVPRDRRGGFNTWIGYENNNDQYNLWLHGHQRAVESEEDVPPYRPNGYETDVLTDRLLDYLEGQAGPDAQPFFACLSVQPPHIPYVAPPEYMANYNPQDMIHRPNVPDLPDLRERVSRDIAGYYAMVENLDANVGRVIDALIELDLYHETRIIFFGDHGDMLGSHGQLFKTLPFQESISIPFIVGGGVQLPYGTIVDHNIDRETPINHVDIAPTTLGLCGIEKPDFMDGYDYSGLMLGGSEPADLPDSAYLQIVEPCKFNDGADVPWRGVLTRDGWKYACTEGAPWLLYNLNDDPYEQMNRVYNYGHIAKRRELNALLETWIKRTGDTFNVPKIAGQD